MNNRKQLLLLATLILTGASLSSVVIASCHFCRAAFQVQDGSHRQPAPLSFDQTLPADLMQPFVRATWLAAGTTLIILISGGTLLIRAVNPFLRRLEESEARVRAILNTAGEGILTVDDRNLVQSFNLACENMFGCSSSEALGGHVSRFIRQEPAPDAAARSVSAHADAQRSDGPHMIGRRADGSTFPLEVCVSEFRWRQRRTFTVIVRDITDQNQAQEKAQRHLRVLRESKEHLEAKATELSRMNRELDDVTHIVWHDLKEPLRGISSHCQTLLEDCGKNLDETGQGRLAALIGLCRRLDGLIDDLFTFSQIGRTRTAAERVDLNRVVADVLETLGPAIERCGGRAVVEGSLPVVCGDAALLGGVFRNLIANGLKFNESPCPSVSVTCLATDPPTICVRDNGIGIAAHSREEIFTMFRRLHSERKYEGSGAGLAFVRRIVEAHDGRVWVDSEPGSGSTFYFTLASGPRPSAADASTGVTREDRPTPSSPHVRPAAASRGHSPALAPAAAREAAAAGRRPAIPGFLPLANELRRDGRDNLSWDSR